MLDPEREDGASSARGSLVRAAGFFHREHLTPQFGAICILDGSASQFLLVQQYDFEAPEFGCPSTRFLNRVVF